MIRGKNAIIKFTRKMGADLSTELVIRYIIIDGNTGSVDCVMKTKSGSVVYSCDVVEFTDDAINPKIAKLISYAKLGSQETDAGGVLSMTAADSGDRDNSPTNDSDGGEGGADGGDGGSDGGGGGD